MASGTTTSPSSHASPSAAASVGGLDAFVRSSFGLLIAVALCASPALCPTAPAMRPAPLLGLSTSSSGLGSAACALTRASSFLLKRGPCGFSDGGCDARTFADRSRGDCARASCGACAIRLP
eukprot:1923939-Rhodomonas_salina.1